MNIGKLDGVKIVLSPEAYTEVKKQKIIEENKILKEQQQKIERLNNIIKEAINYIDDNTYYKDHKWHINIDNLYIILQKGVDKE